MISQSFLVAKEFGFFEKTFPFYLLLFSIQTVRGIRFSCVLPIERLARN